MKVPLFIVMAGPPFMLGIGPMKFWAKGGR
jgi:hypothetical protein